MSGNSQDIYGHIRHRTWAPFDKFIRFGWAAFLALTICVSGITLRNSALPWGDQSFWHVGRQIYSFAHSAEDPITSPRLAALPRQFEQDQKAVQFFHLILLREVPQRAKPPPARHKPWLPRLPGRNSPCDSLPTECLFVQVFRPLHA